MKPLPEVEAAEVLRTLFGCRMKNATIAMTNVTPISVTVVMTSADHSVFLDFVGFVGFSGFSADGGGWADLLAAEEDCE